MEDAHALWAAEVSFVLWSSEELHYGVYWLSRFNPGWYAKRFLERAA